MKQVDGGEDPLARREVIVRAAKELFLERGVSSVRMRDIARAAGIERSTLRRYFDTKEEIFAAALRREVAHLTAAIRAAVTDAPSAEAALERYLHVRVRSVGRLMLLHRILREESFSLQPLVLRVFQESRRELQELLENILRRGAYEGEFSEPDEIEALARGLSLFLRGVDSAVIYEGESVGLELACRAMLDVVLRGLRAGPSRGRSSSGPSSAESDRDDD